MATTAVTPAAGASGSESTSAGPTGADVQQSLVGDDPSALAETSGTETTDPAAGGEGKEGDAGSTDATAEAGTEDGAAAEDGETADADAEETADDWLPEEQKKEFPFEVLSEFAQKRYKIDPERLKNDPQLQLLVKDKLNSDIELRKRLASDDSLDLDGADDAEDETAEAQPVQLTPEQQKEKYYQFVDHVVGKVFDQNAVAELGKNLYSAFGVDLSDPNNEETKGYLANAPKVGATLAKSLVDGVNSAIPYLMLTPNPITGEAPINALLETVMPGISEMYERSMYQMQWDRVANTTDANGQKVFTNLPPFGTPEFTKALEKAGKSIPNFEDIVFRDKQGNALTLPQQAYMKYEMLAQIANGQKPNPAEAARAFSAGKKAATTAAGKRAASKALGAGSHSNSLDPKKTTTDPLDAAIAAANANVDFVPGSK